MRKSLLFCWEKPSVKKNNASMFHATMSSYDGAEVCELVRLFILDSLAKKSGKGKVGIFGYDRLPLLKNTTARAGDESRKNVINVFGHFGLKVTAQTSQKITSLLHITLTLLTDNSTTTESLTTNAFVCTSNYPPSILQIPPSMNKIISQLPSDQ